MLYFKIPIPSVTCIPSINGTRGEQTISVNYDIFLPSYCFTHYLVTLNIILNLICYRLNCVLSKRYVLILTPDVSEYNLIWRWGLYRGNQVKMRSLRLSLIQWDDVLLKRENSDLETNMHRKKKKLRPREKTTLYKPKRKAWINSFPHDIQKEPNLPTS